MNDFRNCRHGVYFGKGREDSWNGMRPFRIVKISDDERHSAASPKVLRTIVQRHRSTRPHIERDKGHQGWCGSPKNTNSL